jgi:Domain of unknown function (DUF4386)
MNLIKKQARFAGLLYLVACLPAPLALLYVPDKLIVPGDATATAHNVRASASLLHLGIAGELINAVAFIFVVFALYELFKGVHRQHAVLMVTLYVVSVPISFLNVLNDIAPLILVSGADFLSVFAKAQLDALVLVFLRLHNYGFLIAQIFWGLWLFPFGILVIRSGFIPSVLGFLLFIAGSAYVASSFTSLCLPQSEHLVGQVTMILELAELPIVIWLLIWGARDQPLTEHSA